MDNAGKTGEKKNWVVIATGSSPLSLFLPSTSRRRHHHTTSTHLPLSPVRRRSCFLPSLASPEFDKILRLLQKSNLTALPGTTVFMPPQFLAALTALPADVDTALKLEKTASKKSSQANAKALNSMKQKVKKTIKENEENINAYQKVRRVCPRSRCLSSES